MITKSQLKRFGRFIDNIITQGKQHWFTSQIPKTYVDGSYLIEVSLFAILINFWEIAGGQERATGYLIGNEGSEEERIIYRLLSEAYEWAKNRRPLAEANCSLLRKVAVENGYTEETMAAVKEAEDDFIAVDTMHMVNIVQFRYKFWS